MPRDLRARLLEEIATSQNDVLTSTREIEHQTATRDLNLKRIARAKLMLAALDGQLNEFSDIMFEVEQPAVAQSQFIWPFSSRKRKEGAPCPAPKSTSTPPPLTSITPLASPRAAKSTP